MSVYKRKRDGESNRQYAERRVRERDEYLSRPMLPPFEHRDMRWWNQVVDAAERNAKR